MKKSEVFFDAITNIREDLLEDALNYQFYRRTITWQRYLRNAACLALVVLVGFSAVRLCLLGGFGGGNSANDTASNTTGSTSSDCSTSESANQNFSAESAEPSTGSQDESGGDSGPSDNVSRFTGTVLEVQETYLLVEPAEGEAILASADLIEVSLRELEDLWEIEVGDEIVITYVGGIQETYPAQLTEVLEIAPAE